MRTRLARSARAQAATGSVGGQAAVQPGQPSQPMATRGSRRKFRHVGVTHVAVAFPTMTHRAAVLYARISVSTEESVSVQRQIASARKYASARGWRVVGEFIDDGVSATHNKPEHRPGWRSLLGSPVPFDAVVVWKVDRLARRVIDFLHADETWQARGASIVCVEQSIDMNRPGFLGGS